MSRHDEPQSRPGAVVLDLRSEGDLKYPFRTPTGAMTSDDVVTSFEDALAKAALDTGLPLVVLVKGARDAPQRFDECPRSQVMVLPIEGRSPGIALQKSLTDILWYSKGDCLWITEPNHQGEPPAGVRACSMKDALATLDKLSHTRRSAAFCGHTPIIAEMAHTVLMPLDFGIGSISNSDLLYDHGRCLFDAVLLVEGLMPLAGFGVKSLEKLIAGYAPLVYSLDDEDATAELLATFQQFKAAGARRIITVSLTHDALGMPQFVDKALRSADLSWDYTTWDELIETAGQIARSWPSSARLKI
ncbi:MAG: hypothetical protein AAFQ59_09810 [Pseudomonadota bacterium]